MPSAGWLWLRILLLANTENMQLAVLLSSMSWQRPLSILFTHNIMTIYTCIGIDFHGCMGRISNPRKLPCHTVYRSVSATSVRAFWIIEHFAS